ncbi:filamentous hemagglutinin N-terminal domain-containing protein [Campylobacter ornithocola]|uniref:filamentous hemagglutinin N-terminal domain-containing protein n=2 Tax=Campylobacter ornithocola TaxID=1848766 RepID=UPI00155DD6D0|nr:filamentous hemagglutinin N-terminal domain-containing protein [Campylobacter ornithocola]QKF57745.1 hemagglutinin domain-containing protein [Campylobacter ornithocola]
MKAHHKLSNHIILSGITVSMLFSPLMALPSGGKFTHGTSGTISGPYFDKNTGKNTIDITGKTPNKNSHVIQWGGGFSINKGESVNFKGQGQNYLNIAHGTSKSTIEGVLNAGGNNVFLINPNGVIIEKSGSIINANRFVASTSSMSDNDMKAFANLKSFDDGLSFSPIFKPKPNGGNVVNMGNINAKNITLQGNKVMLSADTSYDNKNNKIKFNQITADDITLKGNEVYVDISTINSKNLTTDAKNKGIAYLSATGYYYNPTKKYNDIVFTTKGIMDKTYNQYISIGSDVDWWHFAKGWNESEEFRTNVLGNTFKLTNDIDFGANCKNGVCTGQNYANYWIDLNNDGQKQANEYTNMIVGYGLENLFNKNFDGQGFTLKNINIDATKLDNKPGSVGIFGYITIRENPISIKNINVDYMGGGIKVDGGISGSPHVGGFVGLAQGGVSFSNISLNNISSINCNTDHCSVGGFVGTQLYSHITKNHDIFSNISLNNIGVIQATSTDDSNVGGFVGNSENGEFNNISIYNLGSIIADDLFPSGSCCTGAGGFGGFFSTSGVKNIYIYFKPGAIIKSNLNDHGKFSGDGGIFNNATNIHIYHHENDLTNATADQYNWNKFNIHTYNDNTQESVYKDFLSKANTIEKPTPPTPPTNPDNPNDSDVVLGSDDVISKEDLNQWLDEIFAGNYWVDIKDLDKIHGLNESIIQSISFLEALYGQEGMKDILEKFHNDYKTAYSKYDKFKNNKAELLAFINEKLKPLVNSINKANENFNKQDYYNQLNELALAYNKYVELINKGLANKNDQAFKDISNELFALIAQAQGETKTIEELIKGFNNLQAQAKDKSNGHFIVEGELSAIKIPYPILASIKDNNNGSGEIDIPDKPIDPVEPPIDNKPDFSLSFEQSSTFNSIGNEAIDDEEEQEEIEEASMNQKGKTCIVSDNYKTMNPCVVGGL